MISSEDKQDSQRTVKGSTWYVRPADTDQPAQSCQSSLGAMGSQDPNDSETGQTAWMHKLI